MYQIGLQVHDPDHNLWVLDTSNLLFDEKTDSVCSF